MKLLLLFAALCLPLMAATGCATVTVSDYVNRTISRDGGFKALANASQTAERVYHKIADTPIAELGSRHSGESLVKEIRAGRDQFRSAQSYAVNEKKRSLKVDVWLKDYDEDSPGEKRVPIAGSSVYLVVYPTASQISLLRIETSRGKEILSFGDDMTPTISKDFQPLLMGDRVDVQLAQIVKLLRNETIEPLQSHESGGDTYERPRPPEAAAAPRVDSPGSRHCNACGGEAATSARFCPSCGENMNPLPGERAFCQSCGAPRERDRGFCSQCGTKHGD